MWHTCSYDNTRHTIEIASKAWSDFGAHIPLIRYFSKGPLLKLESPLFPGEKIKYHYGFYLLVGLLERAGLRIDVALNLPSSIGFAGYIIMATLLAKLLFDDKRIMTLTPIFLLFNGTLSFLKLFNMNNYQSVSLSSIIHADRFLSFGPWSGDIVTAFWNWNIFTNQRHLAASYALALILIYLVFQRKTQHYKNEINHLTLDPSCLNDDIQSLAPPSSTLDTWDDHCL